VHDPHVSVSAGICRPFGEDRRRTGSLTGRPPCVLRLRLSYTQVIERRSSKNGASGDQHCPLEKIVEERGLQRPDREYLCESWHIHRSFGDVVSTTKPLVTTWLSEEIGKNGAFGTQPPPCIGCSQQPTWLSEVTLLAIEHRAQVIQRRSARTGPLVTNPTSREDRGRTGSLGVNFLHRCTGYSEEIVEERGLW
jgi:hypothetical protein